MSAKSKTTTSDRHRVLTTTVRLPKILYEQARRVLEEGQTEANSLNELLVDSLQERLKQLQRAEIDAGFAVMKDDTQYHSESALLAEQFASNDRETLWRAEKKELK